MIHRTAIGFGAKTHAGPPSCAIFHAGRVGSTVLGTALASLPVIVAGEIYNTAVYETGPWWKQGDYIDLYRRMYQRRLELPQPYVTAPPSASAHWYVFEYKPFHEGCGAPLAEAVRRFTDAGVTHFISLVRENYLRRYISFLVALKSGVWHTHRREAGPTRVSIDLQNVSDPEVGFDGGTLHAALDHYYERMMVDWRSALAPMNTLHLSYEADVAAGPERAFRKVRDFLGADASIKPGAYEQVRQNIWPLRDLIENFDEVERALRNTAYAHLLNG